MVVLVVPPLGSICLSTFDYIGLLSLFPHPTSTSTSTICSELHGTYLKNFFFSQLLTHKFSCVFFYFTPYQLEEASYPRLLVFQPFKVCANLSYIGHSSFSPCISLSLLYWIGTRYKCFQIYFSGPGLSPEIWYHTFHINALRHLK